MPAYISIKFAFQACSLTIGAMVQEEEEEGDRRPPSPCPKAKLNVYVDFSLGDTTSRKLLTLES